MMVEKVLKRFEEEVNNYVLVVDYYFKPCFLYQEHQKSLRSKRQEQRKWEEQNLRQDPSSFDTRMSLDSASASALIRATSLHPRTTSFDYRQPSFDLPLSPQPELPSDEP
jgi:hypothetical protein